VSPKNSRELHICTKLLEVKLLKTGTILSTQWVALSFCSVSAVWQNYEVLVRHFEEAKNDNTRDKKEKCMYESLQRKITSTQLILDLGLMCDALLELSELSLDLQECNIIIYIVNKKIQTLVQIFEERRTVLGPYYENSRKAVDNLCFQGVSLHKIESKNDPAIDPNFFYIKI
jgi:hypothetical protein